jgi:hypothetical protein
MKGTSNAWLERLLLSTQDAGEILGALTRYSREHPEQLPEVTAAIRAAVQTGQLTPEFATSALRTLASVADHPGATQLRSKPERSEATLMRPVTAAAANHTQLRSISAPAPDVEGTLVRAVTNSPTATFDTTQREPSASGTVLRDASTSHFEPAGAIEPTQFIAGAVIKNRFVLEKQIGRGGMGLVFAAIDRRKEEARDPNPRIAVKILNGDFERHPDALMALQREARKAQTLAHPNVVTVFDFDRDGSSVFMTMELLRGRSLDTVVRDARGAGIGRAAALPVIRGIAEGLAYAHRKGIVHSDLKPGNVFLLEDGTPKLLDFGIARAVPSATAEQDVFDAGSLGAYTEAYATDEMVAGTDPHPADDVYALGLIAHELLSGQHAYQRKSVPAARELGLRPQMPRELSRRECRVLEACLAFDRAKRPKDATEFLRQFFGVTRLQKSLLAATVVLAIVAGVFAYRDYAQSGPSVAFSALPAATQAQFTAAMAEGSTNWGFYERDRNVMALYDAVDGFAEAYRLHPRNRDATQALEQAADAFLEKVAQTPEQRREAAQALREKSDYLAKYAPVVEAARD